MPGPYKPGPRYYEPGPYPSEPGWKIDPGIDVY